MATPYFDVTNAAHLALLAPSIREHKELANVAPLAEAAVIGYYTDNPPYYVYTALDLYARQQDGAVLGAFGFTERGGGEDISGSTIGAARLHVYLAGYKADASHADVDPNLKTALRYTIAEVIRRWITGWGREPGIQSSADTQGKSRSYRDNAEETLPPGWNRLLHVFDIRPRSWAL